MAAKFRFSTLRKAAGFASCLLKAGRNQKDFRDKKKKKKKKGRQTSNKKNIQ